MLRPAAIPCGAANREQALANCISAGSGTGRSATRYHHRGATCEAVWPHRPGFGMVVGVTERIAGAAGRGGAGVYFDRRGSGRPLAALKAPVLFAAAPGGPSGALAP
jgi:hypothetical protein